MCSANGCLSIGSKLYRYIIAKAYGRLLREREPNVYHYVR